MFHAFGWSLLNMDVSSAVSSSLSVFRYIGGNPSAAVHFSPAFWLMATAMSLQIRQKLSSLWSNLATPLFENALMPKVRQSPRKCVRLWYGMSYAEQARVEPGAGVLHVCEALSNWLLVKVCMARANNVANFGSNGISVRDIDLAGDIAL